MGDTVRYLGNTGIVVDDITLGTSGLGAGTAAGSDADAVAMARELLAGPFAWVDTANAYSGGRAEEVLGVALRESSRSIPARPWARIATKVDCDPATGALDRDRVMRSFDESLSRLGVDRVPILHLHDPYTVSFAEASGPRGAIDAMVELRDAGAVDAIGIAAGPVPLLRRYVQTGAFDVVLSHNRFTLVDSSAAVLFEQARALGMGTFNAAPFGGRDGVLARGAQPGAQYYYRPASAALLSWVGHAGQVCENHGVTLAAAALAFSLRSPLVDSTVIGVSSPARLAGLVGLREEVVPDALWSALADLGPAPSPIEDAEDA